ncbi:MAG: hypothetical protein JST42_00750 [Bacteroidetes bacterium]|nr:hypothetical protein [Bacteroidota bacterium]
MLRYRDQFLRDHAEDGVAVCGLYIRGDAVHVGLYWKTGQERKVVHFQAGDNIPVEEVTNPGFQVYLFNPIADFQNEFLPSIAALAELVSQNQLNGFVFNRVGIVYEGGKFDFQSGAFTGKTAAEKFVNCAVFLIALLKTYDYTLLNWESWPNLQPDHALELWLDHHQVPDEQKEPFYSMRKEIRGKHALVAPSTQSKPSEYVETDQMALELIKELNA